MWFYEIVTSILGIVSRIADCINNYRKGQMMKKVTVCLVFAFCFCSFAGCANQAGRSSSMEKEQERVPAHIVFEETDIDLGTIPVEENEVIGRIVFFNVGGETLEITKVSGPCACFAGYSGDKVVRPEESGELEVRFDKSKIQAGSVRRVVNVWTNDPENKVAKVHFNFDVQRSQSKEDMRLVKRELFSVHRELKALRKDINNVLNELKKTKTTQAKSKRKRQADTTVYDIAIGHSPVLGPENAAVTIVEFADFQCPHSVKEYPKIKKILKEYPGKVKFVFKHRPLAFHTKARPVHAAAELARLEKGPEGFWKMHDMIMAEPKKLENSVLRGYAESLGLGLTRFDEVMSDEKMIEELLSQDKAEAIKCKVSGTPTVFINGLKMSNRSLESYKNQIEELLKTLAKSKLSKSS